MPFGNILGHIVYREGVLVDLAKVVVILNMPPPTNAKKLRSTLGHIGYYHRFIKIYTNTTIPLENVLKKYEVLSWKPECD
jgi:hypothetical protein